MKENGPPFKIIPGSIVKATRDGYLYCQTDPVHPHAEKRKDRKARYIYVHRVKMENKLGRLIDKDEQVDHKDGDKTNNDASNLVLIKRGPHQKSHAERGNHFWKTSPLNKPGCDMKKHKSKKTALDLSYEVILDYLGSFHRN